MCEKFVRNLQEVFCEKYYWKNSTSFSKVDLILAWIFWKYLQISNLSIFCKFIIIDLVLFKIANYANLVAYPQLVINGEHLDSPHLSKAIDEKFRKQKSKYELHIKLQDIWVGLQTTMDGSYHW